jgi:WD40 repeat protein
VRVLDLPAMSEQSLTVMHGHESPISGLLFLDDEGQAVSSSWDHTIRIWKLPPRR